MPVQSYDHPAFQVQFTQGVTGAAGANAVQMRYVAPYAMRVMKTIARTRTAGTTAGHNHIWAKVSGTTTTAITTFTLSTTAANSTSSSTTTADLAEGDELRCYNGTDATGVADGAVVLQILPSATLAGR